MAYEGSDVTTVEELSIFCHWVEDGVPVEHFLEIVPFKFADAKIIYSTLVEFLKVKHIQISKLVSMGLMEKQHSLENTKGFRAPCRRICLIFWCTSIATYFNLLHNAMPSFAFSYLFTIYKSFEMFNSIPFSA